MGLWPLLDGLSNPHLLRWIHLNLGHHAAVFVVENVAVIHKGSGDIGIPKIHAQGHAGIRASARPIRNLDRVLKVGIRDRHSVDCHNQKVDLVNVEGMDLA